MTANGYGVSFWGDRNVPELDSANSCTTLFVSLINTTEWYTLKEGIV